MTFEKTIYSSREETRVPPLGWISVTIGDIAEKINPGFPSGKHNLEGIGVPHMRPMNINSNGEIDLRVIKYVQPESYDHLSEGDVLFNNTNSAELLGKTAWIKEDTNWAYSNHMTRIRLVSSFVVPAWVSSCMNKLFLDGFFRMHCVHHVNQASISSSFLSEKVWIPLPPFDEQRRIVSKIEELFTKLDAGIESLNKVRIELNRYRESVLKAAFEGKLTEEWRNKHKDEANPALNLSLGGFRSHVESRIPNIWIRSELGKILEKIKTVNPKEEPNKAFVYVDIASIDNTTQKITEPKKYTGRDAPSRARQHIKKDDVLFSTVRTYLKHIAIVPEEYDGQIASTGFCVLRPSRFIKSKFLFYYAQTDNFLNSLNKLQRGTSYPAVRSRDVLSQMIYLPPLSEQHYLGELIDAMLSLAKKTEQTVDTSLKQSERLRRGILRAAFKGRLVPRDPRDEPASKLLEKIKWAKQMKNRMAVTQKQLKE